MRGGTGQLVQSRQTVSQDLSHKAQLRLKGLGRQDAEGRKISMPGNTTAQTGTSFAEGKAMIRYGTAL
jgi:hypothetical protein